MSSCPPPPPESGGILGGRKNIVTAFVFDSGLENDLYDQYIPNVDYLNHAISEWQKQGIDFYGIFHSHFPGGKELSTADKRYIEKIMHSMPDNKLLFPIVFPNESMTPYKVSFTNSQLRFSKENLILINN